MAAKFETVNDYISSFPADLQKRLKKLRALIKKTIPGLTEKISYNMPGYFLDDKYLIYFAGYKNHISLYPVPSGVKELEKDFALYKTSGKGTIQFPNDQPLPTDLIVKILKYQLVKRKAK